MTLLRLYESIPAWLVGAALLMTAGSFVVAWRQQQRYGLIEYKPHLSLGLALVLSAMGVVYGWFQFAPGMAMEQRAGIVRMLLLLLCIGLTHYNAGALRLSLRAWRRKNHRTRHYVE